MSDEAASSFRVGEYYTREQIHEVLGGSIQSYLPFRDGRVVCGCFVPGDAMNPNAPEEVLFGRADESPQIVESAKLVFEQGRHGDAIPIFLKRSANRWEYRGVYLCIGMTLDERVVARKRREHPQRGGFKGVLRFEPVD